MGSDIFSARVITPHPPNQASVAQSPFRPSGHGRSTGGYAVTTTAV
jgi:hypothetical protein